MASLLRITVAAIGVVVWARAADLPSWDAKNAAKYLDSRAAWWSSWPRAARDHDTFCVSCHTALPYALGRPALRTASGETQPAGPEQQILLNIRKRVEMWSEVQPFYNDAQHGAGKSTEARATEAVMEAVILTSYDQRSGQFTEQSRQALDHMLAVQISSGDNAGSWTWLNFHNQPWEAPDSWFWGAALGAAALGNAPQQYRSQPKVREDIALLCEYFARQERSQPLLNRLGLLWASTRLPGILSADRKNNIVQEALSKQREDGGWSASSLIDPEWKRRDSTPAEIGSDGYATAWTAYVLEAAGLRPTSPEIIRALGWLSAHQDKETGRIPAESLNKRRDPATEPALFMSDAATAYAALAFNPR